MDGAGWIKILRRIPAKLHNTISFATSGGEIMAQDILRIEKDFLLLRGRMAGSQDAGHIIVLPFAQIVNLTLNKALKEKEVHEVFGATLPATPASAETTPHEDAEVPDLEPLEETELPATSVPLGTAAREGPAAKAEPSTPAAKAAPISKTLLLERLRQRLAEHAKQPGV